MDKIEKERKAFQVRIRQIQAMDRDLTKEIFWLLGATGAVSYFLVTSNTINFYVIFWPVYIFVIMLLWTHRQRGKYIRDCYDSLTIAVTKGEILDLADIMIAAIVIVNNETLLTKNIKHFKRIPELIIEEI